MNYYINNCYQYHEQTFNIDPSSFIEPLVKNLQEGASILDVGCGSGRDLLWLKKRSFNVTGFEKSSGLANLARQNVGCRVIEGDFEDFDFSSLTMDAIILVGSLVHIPHEKLPIVLSHICCSLKNGGYLLITLKEGNGIKILPDGRKFYLWENEKAIILFANSGLMLISSSRDISKIRSGDIWLSYVLKKTS